MAKTKKEEELLRRRLTYMWPYRVGIVPDGANQQPWLVTKSAGERIMLDSTKLVQAHTLLGEILVVAKSGALDQAATVEVDKKLGDLHVLIYGPDAHKDVGDLTEKLNGFKQRAESALGASLDLSVNEVLEALSTDIDKVLASLIKPEGELGATPEVAPAVTPAVAPATAPVTAVATDGVIANPSDAVVAPVTAEPAAAATVTPEAATEGADEAVATKQDLTELGKTIAAEVTKGFQEVMGNVVKAGGMPVPVLPPAQQPPAQVPEDSAKQSWPDDLAQEVENERS